MPFFCYGGKDMNVVYEINNFIVVKVRKSIYTVYERIDDELIKRGNSCNHYAKNEDRDQKAFDSAKSIADMWADIRKG